jgi:hypothetical protein
VFFQARWTEPFELVRLRELVPVSFRQAYTGDVEPLVLSYAVFSVAGNHRLTVFSIAADALNDFSRLLLTNNLLLLLSRRVSW